jgi:hypothetical protein
LSLKLFASPHSVSAVEQFLAANDGRVLDAVHANRLAQIVEVVAINKRKDGRSRMHDISANRLKFAHHAPP